MVEHEAPLRYGVDVPLLLLARDYHRFRQQRLEIESSVISHEIAGAVARVMGRPHSTHGMRGNTFRSRMFNDGELGEVVRAEVGEDEGH